jgi:hypothetical protein
MDAESNQYRTPLDYALERRSWDIVELFLEWGADMRGVGPESVFGTHRVDLMDRFWDAGRILPTATP